MTKIKSQCSDHAEKYRLEDDDINCDARFKRKIRRAEFYKSFKRYRLSSINLEQGSRVLEICSCIVSRFYHVGKQHGELGGTTQPRYIGESVGDPVERWSRRL